jgi:arylsulfatase A-like enzyme
MLRFSEEEGQGDCIPESLPTLAGQLRAAGYWTLGIVTNLLLYRPGGYERGFDRWVELEKQAPTAAAANLMVRQLLSERPSDRLFLYVHYMDVHDYGRRAEPYAKGVEIADQGVGQLMDILDRQGLREGALIILTSDHGERLDERHFVEGLPGHNGNPSFDSLLKVPLIVSPAVFSDPEAIVRGDDLHRMMLRLAGAGPAPEPDLAQGELFLTELRYQSYRRERWKSYRDRSTGRVHLVDLDADPGETRDVSSHHPEIAASQERRIDELERLLGAGDAPPLKLSDEDRERLRALGYVRTIQLR